MSEMEKPISNEVLEVHLGYLRDEQHRMNVSLQKLLVGMSEMATKSDLEKLSARFVTTEQFNALKEKVEASTLGSTFSRGMKTVQSIAITIAAVAAIFGVVSAFFKYYEIVKALG